MSADSELIDELLNEAWELAGDIFETSLFEIRRPTYTSATSVESQRVVDASFRAEPWSAGPSDTKLPADYFQIYGQRSLFRRGDVFVPTNIDDDESPILTISHKGRKKDCLAFRTNRLCSLGKGKNNIKFSNVRFDFYGASTATAPPIPDMEGSLEHGQQRAILWSREGIRVGWHFIDQSGQIYRIIGVTEKSGMMALSLKESDD